MNKKELKEKMERISEFDPEELLKENYSLLKDLARNLTLAYIIAILLEFTGILSISQYIDTGLFLVVVMAVDFIALISYAKMNQKQKITEAIFVTSVLLIILSGLEIFSILNSSYIQLSLIIAGIISGLHLRI